MLLYIYIIYIVFKSNSFACNNLAYEMKLSMLVFKECLRHMMREKWGRHLYMYWNQTNTARNLIQYMKLQYTESEILKKILKKLAMYVQ